MDEPGVLLAPEPLEAIPELPPVLPAPEAPVPEAPAPEPPALAPPDPIEPVFEAALPLPDPLPLVPVELMPEPVLPPPARPLVRTCPVVRSIQFVCALLAEPELEAPGVLVPDCAAAMVIVPPSNTAVSNGKRALCSIGLSVFWVASDLSD
jgi:hypothetical protein